MFLQKVGPAIIERTTVCSATLVSRSEAAWTKFLAVPDPFLTISSYNARFPQYLERRRASGEVGYQSTHDYLYYR